LEAREARRQAQLFHLQEPLERLGEPIRERLDGGGGHSTTATSLEACREVILRGKRAVCLVLRVQVCPHLVIDGPRLTKAGHQLLALCAVWVHPILKRSHALLVSHKARGDAASGTVAALRAARLSSPWLRPGSLSQKGWWVAARRSGRTH